MRGGGRGPLMVPRGTMLRTGKGSGLMKKTLACPLCAGQIVAYKEGYTHFRVDEKGNIGTRRIEVLESPDETYAVCLQCSSEYRVVYEESTRTERVDLKHLVPARRTAPRRFSDEFKMRVVTSVISGDTEILAREGIPWRYAMRWLDSCSKGGESRQMIQRLWRENQGLQRRMKSIKEEAMTAG